MYASFLKQGRLDASRSKGRLGASIVWLLPVVIGCVSCRMSQNHSDDFTSVMSNGFGGDISPVAGPSFAEARRLSRLDPHLTPFQGRVLSGFHPGRGKITSTLRMAARLFGQWLYVDQHGGASYDGRAGCFDIMAWETLLRHEPSLSSIHQSQIIRLVIVNKTLYRIRIVDECGFTRAEVPPKYKKTIYTWFSRHDILLGSNRIGWLSPSFEDVHSVPGSAKVHLELTYDGVVQQGHSKDGLGQTIGEILRLEP